MARYRAPTARAPALRVAGAAAIVAAAAIGAALTAPPGSAALSAVIAALAVFPLSLRPLLPGRPRAYEVTADAIRVVPRWLGGDVIPLHGVVAVTRLPPDLGRELFREGPLAAAPWLGAAILHLSRGEDVVVVDTEFARYALSPEPVEPFLAEVVAASPGALRAALPPPVRPHLAAGAARPLPRGVVLALGAALAALLAWWAWRAGGLLG